MFTQIDFYSQQSRLNGVSADLKLAATVIVLVLTLSFSSFYLSIYVIISMFLLTTFIGKTKVVIYIKMLKIPLLFVFISGIVLIFEYLPTAEGLFTIKFFNGFICMTSYSLAKTIIVTLNALAGVSILYALCFSTPVYEIVNSLKKCRVPTVVIELIYLIYRYIFILCDCIEKMKTSARLRMGFENFKNGVKSASNIMISLFIFSLKKAGASFDAMQARGYTGRIRFMQKKKAISIKQIIIVLIYIATMLAVFTLERIVAL